MAEPVPATGYGPASWINWTHNWRKEDGDFLQYRGILRYADDASRPSSPQTGQAVYVQATDTVSLWSGEWVPLLSSRLLRLVTSGVSPTGTSTFAHKDASGAGLVFSNTKVRSSIDFETSAGFLADTVSIKTAAGGGNRTSKLTTNPTSLVSDSPILAPTMVLNGASGADALTLSAGNLRVGGSAVIVSSLTAGSVTAPNMYLSGTTQDGAAGAVARKAYVDTQVGTRLATAGDEMTGTLSFGARLGQHINMYSTAFGLGIQSNNLYFRSASAYKFYIGGSHTDTATAATLSVDVNSIDVTGSLTVTGTAAVNGVFYAGAIGVFGGNGGQVRMVDTSAGGNDVYMSFYGAGTTTAQGTRAGYIGYPGSTTMSLINEFSAGQIRLATTGAGDITLTPGAGGEIMLQPNGVYMGKFASNYFLWGKAASDLNNAGIEMFGAGSSAEGSIRSTTFAANIQNLLCRHGSVAQANGQAYIHFYRDSAVAGSVTQNGSTGVLYNTTSDRRAKTIIGPITDAVERFKLLKPYRVTWNDDIARGETDALIADEVQSIIPDAVTGEPDDVYSDKEAEANGVEAGAPKFQGMDYGQTAPLTIATVLELIERVEALEAAS